MIAESGIIKHERAAVASLSAIMAFRLLGLFMILPVFSLYVNQITGATPFLIGLALGIYGLTQAALQIPFGMLSDKIGRKPVITLGLILFALGSLVAALSHGITGIIVGRALQGAGAIGSTILATVADLTRDENRSKAMASVGLTIGCSFALAMVVGPAINAWFHLAGLFWTSMIFAGISLLLLHITVPTPPRLLTQEHPSKKAGRFHAVFKNKALLRLDLGICLLHTMLTALFIAIPVTLLHVVQLTQHQQTSLYIIVLALAFIMALPLIIIAEKKRQMKPVFIGAITTLLISELLFIPFHETAIEIGLILLLFFTAFTLLESTLPSLVSKISPIRNKGTAMGVYSSAQFFGIFMGGTLGGWVFAHFHLNGLFAFCALLAAIWLLCAISMQQPPYLSTVVLPLNDVSQDLSELQQQLSEKPGINEVAIMPEEGLIYFKIDKNIIPANELRNTIRASNLG